MEASVNVCQGIYVRTCIGNAEMQVITGGNTRQESVKLGLAALSNKTKLAAVQDGARPLVTWQVIDRVVRAAHTHGAAIPCIPVKDTIKNTSGTLAISTPDRLAT